MFDVSSDSGVISTRLPTGASPPAGWGPRRLPGHGDEVSQKAKDFGRLTPMRAWSGETATYHEDSIRGATGSRRVCFVQDRDGAGRCKRDLSHDHVPTLGGGGSQSRLTEHRRVRYWFTGL